MTAPDPIVAELRDLRENAGLSQREVAELMGRTQTEISRWESGDRTPDLPTARRWAEALGVGLRIDRYQAVAGMSPAEAYEHGWADCAAAATAAVERDGTEPACSECGGRPKRGLIRSEDDQTWQCEGCYCALVREPDPLAEVVA